MTQPAKPTTQFEIITNKITPRMTLCVDGRTKSGKTWLALSGPGEIGIVSNDSNTKQIAQKYAGEHPEKKIHYVEFLRSPLSQIDDINELKRFWTDYRDAYYRMLAIKSIRTVIVDTHTTSWEDCKLAYVGREKPDVSSEVTKDGKPTGTRFGTQKTIPRDLGEPKREIREMVNAAEDKNLVLICQSADQWKDGPNGIGFKTGKIERKGMPGVEYLCSLDVQLFREEKTGTFVARMMSSTANADIRGREGALVFHNSKDVWQPSQDELINEDINFAMLGISVFPQTEIEDWE